MAGAARPQWLGGSKASCEYPIAPRIKQIFQQALRALNEARLPYVVGGAFALHWYSGFWRVVKDLDVYILQETTERAMEVLRAEGFTTRVKHEQWLAEALLNREKVDLIYGMGNWLTHVDQGYLDRSRRGLVLDVPTHVVPPEELIYSKSFVASRERYDAGDVYHLLVATARQLDWDLLLERFGDHWEVLLSHLVMFRYVYPSHRDLIPPWVLDKLLARFQQTRVEPWTGGKVCRGFLLDGIGTYSLDVQEWGYRDARREAWEEEQEKRARRRAA